MPVLGTHLDGRPMKVNTHSSYHRESLQHFGQGTITKHCAAGAAAEGSTRDTGAERHVLSSEREAPRKVPRKRQGLD